MVPVQYHLDNSWPEAQLGPAPSGGALHCGVALLTLVCAPSVCVVLSTHGIEHDPCCVVLCHAVLAWCRSLYSSLVGLRPMAFLCFELPAGTFDINVTPDKRSVFVQKEVAIVNALGQVRQHCTAWHSTARQRMLTFESCTLSMVMQGVPCRTMLL